MENKQSPLPLKTEKEVIAGFMGWNKDAAGLWLIPEGYARCIRIRLFPTDKLLFDTSFDWLMPVFGKFSSLETDYASEHSALCASIAEKILEVDIFLAHEKLAEGIKWYNEQSALNPQKA
jgi:hypothetical protein